MLSLMTGVETRKGRLMKLLYTDMSQDLTEILTEQATSYAQKGKRVFYIAPNALSSNCVFGLLVLRIKYLAI